METKVQLKRWESPQLDRPPVIPLFSGSTPHLRTEPTLLDYWGTIVRHRAIILTTVLAGLILAALISFRHDQALFGNRANHHQSREC